MQLKRKRRTGLRRTLLASSCALLGTAPSAFADEGDWSFDAGLLYYSEVGRVRATEPAVLATRDFGDDKSLTLKFVVDTLSGATPTGAMPSTQANTITSPSGRVLGTVAAGANPMDNNFSDFRRALTASWSQPLSREWRLDAGGDYSIEHDFKSLGGNAKLSRDFNDRDTTLSAGLSFEDDTVFPIGGIHRPLSVIPVTVSSTGAGGEPGEGAGGGGGEDGGGETDTGGGASLPPSSANPAIAASRGKWVKNALVGVTQVMSRTWLAQANFSYSVSTGYLNDPYNIVSILNVTPPSSTSTTPLGEPVSQIYENRPGIRHERAFYIGNKAYLDGDVLDFSYRYSRDDWGIKSSTYELRYRWAWDDGYYLQPHLRWYRQTAADFYHRGLLSSDAIPAYVSADYRLADFSARTVGLEFGMETGGGHRLRIRLERYVHTGGSDPRVAIGVQRGFDLFPALKANIVQVSFSF